MKYLFILFSILLTENGCGNKSQSKNISFEYSAISRGIFNKITINNETITTQDKHDGELKSRACSETNWKTLLQQLKSVDVNNLSNLEAPSEAHQYDGAAIAHLSITIDGTIYKTTSFDHGNPPKEIEALVKEILSISQKVDKH